MSEIPPVDVRGIVAALAQALDRDDLAGARVLLAEDCVYETGRETHHGSVAIVASYGQASSWARQKFDELRYASEVEAVEGATVTVTFTDYLLKAGARWHRYRCQQAFTVGADGRIVHIVHRELPGERDALEAYFRECGIER